MSKSYWQDKPSLALFSVILACIKPKVLFWSIWPNKTLTFHQLRFGNNTRVRHFSKFVSDHLLDDRFSRIFWLTFLRKKETNWVFYLPVAEGLLAYVLLSPVMPAGVGTHCKVFFLLGSRCQEWQLTDVGLSVGLVVRSRLSTVTVTLLLWLCSRRTKIFAKFFFLSAWFSSRSAALLH